MFNANLIPKLLTGGRSAGEEVEKGATGRYLRYPSLPRYRRYLRYPAAGSADATSSSRAARQRAATGGRAAGSDSSGEERKDNVKGKERVGMCL